MSNWLKYKAILILSTLFKYLKDVFDVSLMLTYNKTTLKITFNDIFNDTFNDF